MCTNFQVCIFFVIAKRRRIDTQTNIFTSEYPRPAAFLTWILIITSHMNTYALASILFRKIIYKNKKVEHRTRVSNKSIFFKGRYVLKLSFNLSLNMGDKKRVNLEKTLPWIVYVVYFIKCAYALYLFIQAGIKIYK